MLIACTGDLHITDKAPRRRLDDYWGTVQNKLNQIVSMANREKCAYLLIPGDIFDTHKESHKVVQTTIGILRKFIGKVLVVAGNHDQAFHTMDLHGTAFETLRISECVKLLNGYNTESDYSVDIYGASWKEPILDPVLNNKVNVLVIHKMVVDEKIWAEQEGHTFANHFLQRNKYDLIVSGDNHNRFVSHHGKKTLINMGSMMRSNTGQGTHKPALAIYNTESGVTTILDLKVQSFESVIAIDQAEIEKERNLALEEFSSTLKNSDAVYQDKQVSFVDALDYYIKKNDVPDSVVNIIKETMEESA